MRWCFKDPAKYEEVLADTVRYRGRMRIGTAIQCRDVSGRGPGLLRAAARVGTPAKDVRSRCIARDLAWCRVQATIDIQSRYRQITAPWVCVQGTADVVTSVDAVLALFEGSASRDKTLLLYQDGWHAQWWEPVITRRRLVADIATWIQQRWGANARGAGGAAATIPRAVIERRPAGTGPFRDDTAFTPSLTPWPGSTAKTE
jgi:hypothetical protein